MTNTEKESLGLNENRVDWDSKVSGGVHLISEDVMYSSKKREFYFKCVLFVKINLQKMQ